jgi:hypothetical protein
VVHDNFTTDSLPGEAFYEVVESAAAVARPTVGPPEAVLEDERLRRKRLGADLRRPLRDSFHRLYRFNHEPLGTGFERQAVDELGPGAANAAWLGASFSRAADVAGRERGRFMWLAISILVLGPLAAAVLGANVSGFLSDLPGWLLGAVEVACLVLAAVLFWVVRKTELHGRWLSARVLAERLRSAFHVAPTHCDFRRVANLENLYIERSSGDWVQRAVEEVWDRRPRGGPSGGENPTRELEQVRRDVASWIQHQIAYHRTAARHHRSWDERLTRVVWGLLALTVVCAAVHAGDDSLKFLLFFTITLPAIGAAVGAWLTVAQHRALRTRYERMESDLALPLQDVLCGDRDLAAASLDAARIISHEGGDWFGTMWFLDVEHP